MKQKLIQFLPLVLFISLIFTACKKDSEKTENPAEEIEIAGHSDDEAMISEQIDAIATDANTVLVADASISGDNSVLDEVICDAAVAINVESDPMTLTISFNGANCGLKYNRTGVVVLSMAKGTQWKDAGAAVTINYENVKITRKSDSKSVTFNGTQLYTNVSGGLVYQAASEGTITHTITGENLAIKFDDGTARNWNIARKKDFTYSNGLVISVTGLHTAGEETTVAEWGTNRFGNEFITSVTSPVVVKQDCDFRVTGGAIKHQTQTYTATATFGLDATGTATTCPGEGNYYYKLGWTRNSNGNNFNVILPY